MKRGSIFAAAGFVLALFLLGKGSVHTEDKSNKGDAADDKKIVVAYAETNLKLAKVELQRAHERNKNSPGAISNWRLDTLLADISVAEAQLAAARDNPGGSTLAVQLALAEVEAKNAELNLQNTQRVVDNRPDTWSAVEIERLRLKASLAEQRVKLWRSPSRPSQVELLQWQNDRLTEEIIDLSHRVRELEAVRAR